MIQQPIETCQTTCRGPWWSILELRRSHWTRSCCHACFYSAIVGAYYWSTSDTMAWTHQWTSQLSRVIRAGLVVDYTILLSSCKEVQILSISLSGWFKSSILFTGLISHRPNDPATQRIILQSDNLQYNMLACWIDGMNDSLTKHLMFLALFFS